MQALFDWRSSGTTLYWVILIDTLKALPSSPAEYVEFWAVKALEVITLDST